MVRISSRLAPRWVRCFHGGGVVFSSSWVQCIPIVHVFGKIITEGYARKFMPVLEVLTLTFCISQVKSFLYEVHWAFWGESSLAIKLGFKIWRLCCFCFVGFGCMSPCPTRKKVSEKGLSVQDDLIHSLIHSFTGSFLHPLFSFCE